METCMTHHDILTMNFVGILPREKPYEVEKTYCECGAVAEFRLCTDCINSAILDKDTRLAYINSDQGFISDYMEFTDGIWSSDEPTQKELEFVKYVDEDDKWNICAAIRWINEDRGHFADWVYERKVDV